MFVYVILLCCCLGLKYASENENDLKDKMDFVEPDPHHFPPGGNNSHSMFMFIQYIR